MQATSKPKFVYVTYINTTPDKLWEALTSGEFTKQYWFGSRIESDWREVLASHRHHFTAARAPMIYHGFTAAPNLRLLDRPADDAFCARHRNADTIEEAHAASCHRCRTPKRILCHARQ